MLTRFFGIHDYYRPKKTGKRSEIPIPDFSEKKNRSGYREPDRCFFGKKSGFPIPDFRNLRLLSAENNRVGFPILDFRNLRKTGSPIFFWTIVTVGQKTDRVIGFPNPIPDFGFHDSNRPYIPLPVFTSRSVLVFTSRSRSLRPAP